MKSFNQHITEDREKLDEDLTEKKDEKLDEDLTKKKDEKLEEDFADLMWAAAAGGGLFALSKVWDKWGAQAVAALPFATDKMKAAAIDKKKEQKDKKISDAEKIADNPDSSEKAKMKALDVLDTEMSDEQKKERAKKIADDPKSSREAKKKAEKDLAKFSSSVEKAQRKLDKQKAKEDERTTKADAAAIGYKKDEDGIIISVGDAEKYKKKAKKAPTGWETGEDGKLIRKDEKPEKKPDEPVANTNEPESTSYKPKGTKMTITESNELQAIMALDDAGIKAEINRKGEVSVKKKDLKKAQKELKKSFKKGGEPKLVGEEVDWDRFKLDEKWKEGTYTITDVKTGKVLGKFKSGAKAQKAADDIFQKGDYDAVSVEVDEGMQESAYDKIKRIRNKLNEGIDAVASRELKLYIEQDRDLYRQQIIPIVKNVQRKMKKGTYDHAKAPKLWLYLVDNGAKKYVKEFGGDFKRDWPKDLRMSIANEFANEYKAEIEIQSGEMF